MKMSNTYLVLPSISSVVGDRGRRGDELRMCKAPVIIDKIS